MFAAVTATVVLASLVPLPGGGPDRFLLGVGLDKWVHGVGYAAVSATFARARTSGGTGAARPKATDSTVPTGSGPRWRVALAAVLVGTAVGGGVELLQTALATRTASFADAAANGVGAACGALVWLRSSTRPRR